MSPYLGVTIDQLIANKYGQDTILSSIQVGVEDTTNFGNCNWGYSCAYTNSISWPNATSRFQQKSIRAWLSSDCSAMERTPRSDSTEEAERQHSRFRNAGAWRYQEDLSEGDRSRLDTYTENIREIERRINIAMSRSVKEPSAEIPFGIPDSNLEHYKIMYDLLALAFEGDITRSATYMLGRDLSGASFPECGFNGGWHGSSHHGDKPENIANYAKMNRYHVQNLADFCQKLKNTPEGDGSVLDHILIYKGSNMGNSHRHAHVKVPVILVGGIDGTFKGNRHIVFPDNMQKTSNMLLSILHYYGIERESIGQSSGPLPGFVG